MSQIIAAFINCATRFVWYASMIFVHTKYLDLVHTLIKDRDYRELNPDNIVREIEERERLKQLGKNTLEAL